MDETRRQNLIAIGVTITVLAAMVAAFFLGGRSGEAPTAQKPTSHPTQTSSPAKTADKQPERHERSTADSTNGDRQAIPSSTSRTADSLPEAVAELIHIAVNNRETAAGIASLEDYLRSGRTVAAAAEVYQALGSLHLRKSPPSVESAISCFQEAATRAETPAIRDEARLSGVQLLMAQGRDDEAAAMLQAHASGGVEWTPAALQLDILVARRKESAQEWDDAETIYESILSRVEQIDSGRPGSPRRIEAAYRQACVYLSRIYQRSGRTADAEALAQRVKLRAEEQSARAAK